MIGHPVSGQIKKMADENKVNFFRGWNRNRGKRSGSA